VPAPAVAAPRPSAGPPVADRQAQSRAATVETAALRGRAPAAPAAAPPAPSADRALAGCCEQCLDASARDPSGFDLRVERCLKYGGTYNGGPGVAPACAALFERQGTRVGQCQALLAR
jgi:hypothetical protein